MAADEKEPKPDEAKTSKPDSAEADAVDSSAADPSEGGGTEADSARASDQSTEKVDTEAKTAEKDEAKKPGKADAKKTKKQAAASSEEAKTIESSPAARRRLFGRDFTRSSSACLFSTVVHMVVVIGLGLWMMPQIAKTALTPLMVDALKEPEDPLETVELDEQLVAATDLTFTEASSAPLETAQTVPDVELDDTLLADEVVTVEGLIDTVPTRGSLLEDMPDGGPGKAREVVDGYQQAIDRITREILKMLYEQNVLLIWCFDQSESMKDDQKEIRDRIERIYAELGLSEKAQGDALLTAVTSYGKDFVVHTKKPTSDLQEIREAVDAVPIDKSGTEMMCQAVGRSISMYKKFASRGQRKLALILVTDESGDRANNNQFLEATIAEAKATRCRVFILGREAVFGYPYVYISWTHPQTKRTHWLQVDRGPETAFCEQIQTDGFRRRYDAYPSGYGPYEQSRLAHQSSGIFFMLPSLESKLVRGEKRRYELEIMRPYVPDLRARVEIFAERDKTPLQTLLWKIISDLDPYNENSAKVIEMRVHFSPDFKTFVEQVRQEQSKAKIYLTYLDQASKTLDTKRARHLRDKETDVRWQANFDMLQAQLLAYQARIYEYGAYLDVFVKNPKVVPLKKPPNLTLTYWDIRTRKETITGAVIRPYVERANTMLAKIAKERAGTPWGGRAQWELNRGFGVDLAPVYEPPYPEVSNPIPVPNL